jgi:hypothetical protein
MRTSFLVSTIFLTTATAASFAITACSSADSKESNAEAEIQQSNLGRDEGASCNRTEQCKTGLVCKGPSSGPPPGAVGLPLPPEETEQSGPPPGAVGLPLPPAGGTCQKPTPGEEGGKCDAYTPCDPGLYCDYDGVGSSSSGGPPPGAVGLPLPPSERESSGPPPGAVGLPLPPTGICKPSSSGSSSSGSPPPGAVGLPLPPND